MSVRREEVIRDLLGLWRDCCDPMQSGNGGTSGEGWLRMPGSYTDSFRELERLLKSMRDDRTRSLIVLASGEKVSVRKLGWHVSERFIRSTTKNGWQTIRRRNVKGKMVTERVRAIVTVVHPDVREDLVTAGIRWLATEWSLPHEPFLPKQVVDARSQVAGHVLEAEAA